MDDFSGRRAVITGAGSGIGRELALQLAQQGCDLALLDIDPESVDQTAEHCRRPGLTVSVHPCDVSDEAAVNEASRQVLEQHDTTSIHLLFNNAGIGATEGFLDGDRVAWERTFDICWGGVYLCSRAFVPAVVAADEGHIINISSINGFWASLGPSRTHTAYSAAKFAVRGFTEALMVELAKAAPHVGVSVVMPGHIGTNIVANSNLTLGRGRTHEVNEIDAAFREVAPTKPAEAASVILDGVKAGRWRILIGRDAEVLDEAVRADPEAAYDPAFVEWLHSQGLLIGLIG